jgi:protease-4
MTDRDLDAVSGQDPDAVIARRRLRRRLGLWRLLAVLAVLVAVGAWVWRADVAGVAVGPHVALVAVEGPIFDDPERNAFLRALAEDDAVRAVMLRINSPGGSVAGSEALYAALRAVAETKPLVAVMGELAASGGYIAALAADHIVARGGTLTGSIGVVAEFPNIAGLLDSVGVEVNQVASGPLKAEPSPFRSPREGVLAAQRTLIADSYAWFLGLVAERRGIDPDRARDLGDGRVYTGRQAAEAGLIDALGGPPEARAWLADARDVSRDLPLREREAPRPGAGLLDELVGAAADGAAALAAQRAPRLMAILR